jgi:hypothetical protein
MRTVYTQQAMLTRLDVEVETCDSREYNTVYCISANRFDCDDVSIRVERVWATVSDRIVGRVQATAVDILRRTVITLMEVRTRAAGGGGAGGAAI